MKPFNGAYGRSIVLWVCLSTCFCLDLQSQTDTTKKFSFSGYIEGYFSYDFAQPEDQLKPSCYYSFNRHNEPNINLALLKGSYQSTAFRGNAAFMAGTYSRYNLAAEPGFLQHIFELNAGIKIGPKNLWLDAGVLPSHVGLEGAIGKDYWNLSRSVMAENSPYFETGMKLGLDSDNGKWYVALLLLNGWQRIKTLEGNSLPSFGHQLQFKPRANIIINSSSLVGTDKPDSSRKMRYFHDLYATFQVSEKLGLQASFDIGMEQKQKGSNSYHVWHTMLAGLQYKWSGKIRTAMRMEYYRDKAGVIVSSETGLPFSVWGVSANADYQVLQNLLFRLELRGLFGREVVFLKQGAAVQSNSAITTSLAFHF